MLDYKIVLGVVATLVGIVSYVIYFRNIFRGKTKPHAFSWFVWAILVGIAFAIQVAGNGGAGAWVTGLTAVACLAIAVLALFVGKRDFPLVDWLCLASAFVAMGLWWSTSNPTAAVILVSVTDAVAFLPSFRKGFAKPHEETATLFALAAFKFIIALFALETFSLATALYPASLVLTNGLFVTLLLLRRKQVRK